MTTQKGKNKNDEGKSENQKPKQTRSRKTSQTRQKKAKTGAATKSKSTKGQRQKRAGGKTQAAQQSSKKKAAEKEVKTGHGKTDTTKAKTEESRFWEETKESFRESAKVLSEEAKKMGSIISSYSEVVFGKIKTKTSEALKYGQELTRDAVAQAQEIGEDLKDNYTVARLNNEKKKLSSQLGMKLYLSVKNNKNKIPENLIEDDKEVASLLKQIEDIDKELLKLSKQENK